MRDISYRAVRDCWRDVSSNCVAVVRLDCVDTG